MEVNVVNVICLFTNWILYLVELATLPSTISELSVAASEHKFLSYRASEMYVSDCEIAANARIHHL